MNVQTNGFTITTSNQSSVEMGLTPNQSCSTNPTPKKRAETWVQEETLALILLRKETDSLFNTSKFNRHLWENILLKMREKGFDRSPAMCTDKWRNLLKEFKKGKVKDGNGSVKTGYYLEIEEILKGRNNYGNNGVVSCDDVNGVDVDASGSKVDSFMHFADKGIDDVSLSFGPLEDNGRSTINLETLIDHEGHPLAITAGDVVAANGTSPCWNWRETPGNDEQDTFGGRVITVKLGDYARRICIDASHDAIKDAITSVFRLRSRRAFWLEDAFNVVRSIDRDMPLGNYTLHVDEGLTIKFCAYNEADNMPVHTESKTFYSQEDFCDFFSCRGWTCLRDCSNYRHVDSVDDLCPNGIYRGVN